MSEQRSWGVNFTIVEDDDDDEFVHTRVDVVGASSDMEKRGLLALVEEHLQWMRKERRRDAEEA